jgi:hypothetical protein
MDRDIASRAYHYLLDLEVDGSDRENLVDSLEDEEFPIREVLGETEMVRQIKEGRLVFDQGSSAPLAWFRQCIEVLSVHLSEYIIGLEVIESRNKEGTRTDVAITKYAGRMGETIAVPLKHRIEFPSGEITPLEEDLDYLEKHFAALPRWAQDAYRIKFPPLRRL